MKLKVKGFDRAIKNLSRLATNLESNMKKVIKKLADIGVEKARSVFNDEALIYDGINDVVVDDARWVGDNKIEIVARGQAVAFIEFGTGIVYPDDHPLASQLGIARGTYGQGKGSNPTWAYYGQKGKNTTAKIVRTDPTKGDVVLTEGNPPAYGMYKAGEEIKSQILKIVKEELLKWLILKIVFIQD